MLRRTSKYQMSTTSATYAVTLDHATDIAIQLRLPPCDTIIEPSRACCILFDDLTTATAFRLRFDAEPLAYDDPSQFLMSVLDDQEIEPWLASSGSEYERVEFVAVQFGSAEDQERFEGMLWPEG